MSIGSFQIVRHLSTCYPICFQIVPTFITVDKNNDISSMGKGLKSFHCFTTTIQSSKIQDLHVNYVFFTKFALLKQSDI